MNNKGILLSWGDIAPYAKENFEPTTEDSQYNNLQQLQKYNLTFENYSNPCELYNTLLDGSTKIIPENAQRENLGLWSKQVSKSNGNFAEPIVLTLISTGKYTSSGIYLTFDTDKNIYPTQVNIQWWRDTTKISDATFHPNSAKYFCDNSVSRFDRVIITFFSLNMPLTRLRLRSIDFGEGLDFRANELKSVTLVQEISPISTELKISTMDFVLESKTDREYNFQKKQPIKTYFNDSIKAVSFIKKATQTSKNTYKIQCEDYIGMLDSVPFAGGIYTGLVQDNVYEVLEGLFNKAQIPFEMDESLTHLMLRGYIPYTTCREALMQIAFAIQAVVDTSNSEKVRILPLQETVSQEIPLRRIMQGQSFEDEDVVTAVEITSHRYIRTEETIDVYKAEENGTGENIFIKFSEPLHDLTITNGSFAINDYGNEIKHPNYAVINANENCVLAGKKYEHLTQIHRKDNPLTLANDVENVISINNATLVSGGNIDNILDKCYNWLVKNKNINLKIVEGRQIVYKTARYGSGKYGAGVYGELGNVTEYDQSVNVGDKIRVETKYLGVLEGTVIKQSFSLNGNKIIKDCVVR